LIAIKRLFNLVKTKNTNPSRIITWFTYPYISYTINALILFKFTFQRLMDFKRLKHYKQVWNFPASHTDYLSRHIVS
jgi:hypothetical protein